MSRVWSSSKIWFWKSELRGSSTIAKLLRSKSDSWVCSLPHLHSTIQFNGHHKAELLDIEQHHPVAIWNRLQDYSTVLLSHEAIFLFVPLREQDRNLDFPFHDLPCVQSRFLSRRYWCSGSQYCCSCWSHCCCYDSKRCSCWHCCSSYRRVSHGWNRLLISTPNWLCQRHGIGIAYKAPFSFCGSSSNRTKSSIYLI